MQSIDNILTVTDGQELVYTTWRPDSTTMSTPYKAVVLLLHGMEEHPSRYQELAEYLVGEGFVVVAPAHRGHGKTGHLSGTMGFFANKNGWQRVLDDIGELDDLIRRQYPQLPVVLIGHSMGSMLARCYIREARFRDGRTKLAGCVLCGTVGPCGIDIITLRGVIGILCRLFGTRRVMAFPNWIFSVKNNRAFRHDRSGSFAWISRDTEKIRSFEADPDCGFSCTNGFFRDLLDGYITLCKQEKDEAYDPPHDLPLLYISGEDDPVGDFGKGVQKAVELVRSHALQRVDLKLYPGARHALFEESNRRDVMADVVSWIGTLF